MTGPPATLFIPTSKVSDTSIGAWIQADTVAKKLVLDLPFYGRGWRLVKANNHGIFALANGTAVDELRHSQIKDFISDYCYFRMTWIGFDDSQSISTKARATKLFALTVCLANQVEKEFRVDLVSVMSWPVEAWSPAKASAMSGSGNRSCCILRVASTLPCQSLMTAPTPTLQVALEIDASQFSFTLP
ncbi:class V chitinase-like [Carya illinoinensis]|uniref:class V chitinase-like n=1 Tax=Carya illinoinensis TaxID=32201 RepID=UPI001C72214A|nr:class V chitinase-like [Carya illinoinensis]